MTIIPRRRAALNVIAIAASLTAIASLGATTRASAQSFAGVEELAIGGKGAGTKGVTSLKPITLKGKLAEDLQFNSPSAHQADNYTATAKPGRLSVSSHVSAADTGNLDGAKMDLRAQFQDDIKVKGIAAGKQVILHKTIAVTGGTTFIDIANKPESRIEVDSDLLISGSGVPQGPYFPAVVFGVAAFATSRHVNNTGLGENVDRDLFAPAFVDYAMLLTAGESNRVFFGLETVTEAFGTGHGFGSITTAYDLNFDTGPGFFTLADEFGRDTGVRAGPGLTLTSFSRFNYLAAAGQGAAEMDAVPEPAAWALMIGGFGAAGAALRRRRAAAYPA